MLLGAVTSLIFNPFVLRCVMHAIQHCFRCLGNLFRVGCVWGEGLFTSRFSLVALVLGLWRYSSGGQMGNSRSFRIEGETEEVVEVKVREKMVHNVGGVGGANGGGGRLALAASGMGLGTAAS